MLIPSESLLQILHKSQSGIWPEVLIDNSIGLVVKLPQTVIKRIYRGTECKLTTAVIRVGKYSILYLGFIVHDDANAPLVVIQPVATKKALAEFEQMFGVSPVKLYLFDELSHPLLEASCNFDLTETTYNFDMIMKTNPHVLECVGSDPHDFLEFGRSVIDGIDIFQKDLESIKIARSSVSMPNTNHVIPLSLIIHGPPEGFSVDNMGNTVEFTVTQEDEGRAFEELLSFTMSSLYPQHSYVRPLTALGKNKRELADFLALSHSDDTIILVQAKSTASLKERLDKPSRKHASSVEKKVEDCSRQLEGAIKRIRAGNQVYDLDGNKIEIPNPSTSLIHGIIMVSDLYAFVDWIRLGMALISLSDNEEYKALFQVVDLQELQQLVKNSGSAEVFHNYLLGRWLKVKISGTAHVRSRNRLPWDETDAF